MKIEHIAIWVNDLEVMKDFYTKYFNMKCSNKYENPKKKFASYFLSFDNGARIEIMFRADISEKISNKGISNGLTHIAFSVGSIKKVDELTEVIRNNGFEIYGEPRTTGDGYYESVVLDPEGNHIEITE
ncbi:MAG: glyoxalase/bleomycin resistance/extradiol dioxygenase family protein [Draconibacterium sp.]|nr:glyoxalase/bleomycin resistance/extradiol dioxygenase family protein [Draconibacterium sp.]